jgi:hypothetical protein
MTVLGNELKRHLDRLETVTPHAPHSQEPGNDHVTVKGGDLGAFKSTQNHSPSFLGQLHGSNH